MPANYIVINSKFKPFSYAEMLQPVQMATLAHQEVENEYADLATKANVWDVMANEQTDPEAYRMYKNYADDLRNQNLWKNPSVLTRCAAYFSLYPCLFSTDKH